MFNGLNIASKRVLFNEMSRDLYLEVYQVRTSPHGAPSQAECLTNLRTLRQMYPVAEDAVHVSFRGIIRTSTLDLVPTAEELALGAFLVEFMVASGHLPGEAIASLGEPVFLALTDPSLEHRGMTLGRFSVSVAADTDFFRVKTAHESAHALGMHHVRGCDAPWPFEEEYPLSFAPDGTLYPRTSIGDWGIEFGLSNTVRLWSPIVANEFMTYCDHRWVSKYSWNWLYDTFSPARSSLHSRTGENPQAVRVRLAGPPTEAPYLSVIGFIAPDGSGRLSPAWRKCTLRDLQTTLALASIRLFCSMPPARLCSNVASPQRLFETSNRSCSFPKSFLPHRVLPRSS